MKSMHKIETSTEHGLHTMYLLDRPLADSLAGGMTVRIADPGDMAKVWADHEAQYGGQVKLKPWKEDVLCVPEGTEIDVARLELAVTTSYMAQMVRDHGAGSVLPLTVQALTTTRDGRIDFGVRAGFVQNGKVSLRPLGYAGIAVNEVDNLIEHPLFGAFYGEAKEEVGIFRDEFETVELIGYQTDPQFTKGINFVFRAVTTLSSQEVRERHDIALDVYQKAHDKSLADTNDKGVARRAAKKAVKDAHLPNIDAGDHKPVFFVEDDAGRLRDLVTSGSAVHDGHVYPLMTICSGGLQLRLDQMLR